MAWITTSIACASLHGMYIVLVHIWAVDVDGCIWVFSDRQEALKLIKATPAATLASPAAQLNQDKSRPQSAADTVFYFSAAAVAKSTSMPSSTSLYSCGDDADDDVVDQRRRRAWLSMTWALLLSVISVYFCFVVPFRIAFADLWLRHQLDASGQSEGVASMLSWLCVDYGLVGNPLVLPLIYPSDD